jgi:hypothetical protein
MTFKGCPTPLRTFCQRRIEGHSNAADRSEFPTCGEQAV